jgi:hypothetical protein
MEPEELLNENTGKDKESPLLSLEVDLKFFNESIREVAIEIMVEGLSKYHQKRTQTALHRYLQKPRKIHVRIRSSTRRG